jgi:hypothetical protein
MKISIFNPFIRIAGPQALMFGLLAIGLSSWLAFVSNVHFDGVIDIHFGMNKNIYPVYLIEAMIIFFSVTLVFYLLSLFFGKSRARFIDIAGTMSFSRIPLIIIPLFALIFPVDNVTQHYLYKYTGIGSQVDVSSFEISLFFVLMVFVLAVLIWYITLMYNAFRISCNLKSTPSVLLFIVGLILAEILSKIVLIYGIGIIYLDLKH